MKKATEENYLTGIYTLWWTMNNRALKHYLCKKKTTKFKSEPIKTQGQPWAKESWRVKEIFEPSSDEVVVDKVYLHMDISSLVSKLSEVNGKMVLLGNDYE